MSRYAILALTGALVILTGCAKKAPLTPATPWADIPNDALCFLTTATDPNGLKLQYIFDWGNGDTTTTGFLASGDTACCACAFSDSGTYLVKVKVRNEQGRASAWSAACVFRASMPPQPADTVAGFPRWAVDRWYRPSVKVTDPDGDSVSVKFIWGDSMVSNWSPFVASGSTVNDSVKWQTIGRHVIHVLLKDKGSMVNQNAGAKSVNVSTVAVLWVTPDSEQLGSDGASPAMGQIDGEPVLYIVQTGRVVCVGLDRRLKWATEVGWNFDFAPSLSNDGSRLYLTELDEGLFCLDARTGSILWNADVFGCYGTLAVGPDGALYSTTIKGLHDDTAFVVRIRDCGDSAHVQWRARFPFAGDPGWGVVVGANGTIYAECRRGDEMRGAVMALDTNGTVLWHDTTHIERCGWMYAPVIDSRGRVITGDDNANLLCFNEDGTLAWSTDVGWGLYSGGITVGYDDRIYFQSEDYRLYCYDSNGNRVWAEYIPNGAYSLSSPCALSDSTVLVYSCEESQVVCFSWDGDVLWMFSLEDSVEETSPARGLPVRGRTQTGGRDEGDGETTPLVGPDGNVYFADFYFTYCLAVGKARLANTAWPTYNHDNARSGWAGRH